MTDTDAIIRDKNMRAKAFIEYKHGNGASIDLDSPEMRGHLSLASDLLTPLPVYVVAYFHLDANNVPIHAEQYPSSTYAPPRAVTAADIMATIYHRQYFVVAANIEARAILGAEWRMLSERGYRELLAETVGEPARLDDAQTSTVIVRTPAVSKGPKLLRRRTYHRPRN